MRPGSGVVVRPSQVDPAAEPHARKLREELSIIDMKLQALHQMSMVGDEQEQEYAQESIDGNGYDVRWYNGEESQNPDNDEAISDIDEAPPNGGNVSRRVPRPPLSPLDGMESYSSSEDEFETGSRHYAVEGTPHTSDEEILRMIDKLGSGSESPEWHDGSARWHAGQQVHIHSETLGWVMGRIHTIEGGQATIIYQNRLKILNLPEVDSRTIRPIDALSPGMPPVGDYPADDPRDNDLNSGKENAGHGEMGELSISSHQTSSLEPREAAYRDDMWDELDRHMSRFSDAENLFSKMGPIDVGRRPELGSALVDNTGPLKRRRGALAGLEFGGPSKVHFESITPTKEVFESRGGISGLSGL